MQASFTLDLDDFTRLIAQVRSQLETRKFNEVIHLLNRHWLALNKSEFFFPWQGDKKNKAIELKQQRFDAFIAALLEINLPDERILELLGTFNNSEKINPSDNDILNPKLVASLFDAIKKRSLLLTGLLLYWGVDVNSTDSADFSLPQTAAFFGRTSILKYLAACGARMARLHPQNHATVLHSAVGDDTGQTDMLDWILDNVKLDNLINLQQKDGLTALHIAAKSAKPNKLKKLLERGADTNLFDNQLDSPLHVAIHSKTARKLEEEDEKNAQECVLILLEKNPNAANTANTNGQTPLHYAARFKRAFAIPLLLHHKASYTQKDNNNKTPRDFWPDYDWDAPIIIPTMTISKPTVSTTDTTHMMKLLTGAESQRQTQIAAMQHYLEQLTLMSQQIKEQSAKVNVDKDKENEQVRQTIAAFTESVTQRLESFNQELKAVKEGTGIVTRTHWLSSQLQAFYDVFQFELNALFMTYMVKSTGLIASPADNSTIIKQGVAAVATGSVSTGLSILGASFGVPFLGIVVNPFGAFASNLITRGHNVKSNETAKQRMNPSEHVGVTQFEQHSADLAELATQIYQNQILQLTEEGAKKLACCGVKRLERYAKEQKDQVLGCNTEKDFILALSADVEIKQDNSILKLPFLARTTYLSTNDEANGNVTETDIFARTGLETENHNCYTSAAYPKPKCGWRQGTEEHAQWLNMQPVADQEILPGNCAFDCLQTNRTSVVEIFQNNLSNDEFRNQLAEEVENDIFCPESQNKDDTQNSYVFNLLKQQAGLHTNDQDLQSAVKTLLQLQEEYISNSEQSSEPINQAQQEGNELLKELKPDQKDSLPIEELIPALQSHKTDEENETNDKISTLIVRLESLQQKQEQKRQQRLEALSSQAMIKTYIKYYIATTGWLGPQSIYCYAKLKEINVYFWTTDKDNSYIQAHGFTHYHHSDDATSYHLQFVKAGSVLNHFVPVPKEKIPALQKQLKQAAPINISNHPNLSHNQEKKEESAQKQKTEESTQVQTVT